jgi:hypothetical protein
MRRQYLSIRQNFHETPSFSGMRQAKIFMRRQYFEYPPEFSWDAKISGMRNIFMGHQDFRYPLVISYDANSLCIR